MYYISTNMFCPVLMYLIICTIQQFPSFNGLYSLLYIVPPPPPPLQKLDFFAQALLSRTCHINVIFPHTTVQLPISLIKSKNVKCVT